jgi:hypothetical protein
MILIQINESHVFDTCIILFHGTFEKSCFFIKPINLLLLVLIAKFLKIVSVFNTLVHIIEFFIFTVCFKSTILYFQFHFMVSKNYNN